MDYTPTPTGPPPLLRLPAEIRVEIYDHIGFIQDCPLSIYDASSRPPALGQVCKILREEAMGCFFGRNRFIVSNAMALASDLKRTSAENVSRIAHLRLKHLGCDTSGSTALLQPGQMYVDVDILGEAPWFRVTRTRLDIEANEPTQDPTVVVFVRGKGLLVSDEESSRFERLPSLQVRLLLVPTLMAKVLESIARGSGVGPLTLDGRMLEFIVKNWLWASHILTCAEPEPSRCDLCVRALGWLSVEQAETY